MATDTIFVKYEQNIDDVISSNRKMIASNKKVDKSVEEVKKEVAGIPKAYKKTAESVKKETGAISNQFNQLAGRIAIAFSIDAAIRFTRELITLGAKIVPIRAAFQRIGDGKLLDGLLKATRGTVTDLELMRQAVRAENFKIPLEEFGRLLEFAQRRARETGEEVDFLVDSIVSGIGRKSPLILDNLGISAIELRSRLKGVGVESATIADITRAVGAIVEEEFEQMGEAVDSTADKMDRAAASFENAKAVLGEQLLPIVGAVSDEFSSQVKLLQSEEIPALTKLKIVLADLSVFAGFAVISTKSFSDELDLQAEAANEAARAVEDLTRERKIFFGSFEEDLPDTNIIDPLLDLEGIETIGQFQERIKDLQKAIKDLKPDTDALRIANAFLADIQDIVNKALGKTTQADKDLKEETKKLTKEQIELDKAFKRLLATLQKDFVRASQAAKREFAELIKATKKANDEAREFAETQTNLALNNAEQRAEIANNEIALEEARFAKRLQSLKLTNKSVEELTKQEQKALQLLTEEHENILTQIRTDAGLDNQLVLAKLSRDEREIERAEFDIRKEELERQFTVEGQITEEGLNALALLRQEHADNVAEISQEEAEKGIQIAKGLAAGTANLAKLLTNDREKELENLRKLRDAELISEKEFDNKSNAIRAQQARALQAQALFQIGIAQAVAIAELVKDVQEVGLTPIDKALIFAAGFAQITAGLAQARGALRPVPGFEGGVENFGGGYAMVGEGGRELVRLPKGTDVIPNHKTEKIMNTYNAQLNDQGIINAVNNSGHKNVNIGNIGQLARANRQQTYLDTRYRV